MAEIAEGAEHVAESAKGGLTRRVGPLPVWGWAVVAVGGFVAWRAIGSVGGGGGGSSGTPAPSTLPGAARTPGAGGGGGSAPSGLPSSPVSLPSPTVVTPRSVAPPVTPSAIVPSAVPPSARPTGPGIMTPIQPVAVGPGFVPPSATLGSPAAEYIPPPPGAPSYYIADPTSGVYQPISGTGIWGASPELPLPVGVLTGPAAVLDARSSYDTSSISDVAVSPGYDGGDPYADVQAAFNR